MTSQFCHFSLAGKTILVTGASSGIGRQTAIDCSRMGAHILLNGRNEERLKSTLDELEGNKHRLVAGDLNDENSLSQIVDSVEYLDGVVLCAGVCITLPVQFATRKKISTVFETNFFSQTELLRLLLKKKKLTDGASVVAISSIGGNRSFNVGIAPYGASKAALLSWMKTAAKELASRIRVNCVLPGQVNTPMTLNTELSEEQYESYKQTVPMKRFAETTDITPAVIFLLSDASSYMTGAEIVIDGGVTL